MSEGKLPTRKTSGEVVKGREETAPPVLYRFLGSNPVVYGLGSPPEGLLKLQS